MNKLPKSETLIIGFDLSDGTDSSSLSVSRHTNKKIESVNAYFGDEAEQIYEWLVNSRGGVHKLENANVRPMLTIDTLDVPSMDSFIFKASCDGYITNMIVSKLDIPLDPVKYKEFYIELEDKLYKKIKEERNKKC